MRSTRSRYQDNYKLSCERAALPLTAGRNREAFVPLRDAGQNFFFTFNKIGSTTDSRRGQDWVTEKMVTDLKRWLRAREKFAKSDYVFFANDGKPMGVLLMPHVLGRYKQDDDYTSHSPSRRHFVCTRWIKNGADIPRLQGDDQTQTT